MRIRRDLPQFEKNMTLLVVTGRFGAEIFRAHRGNVVSRDQFEIPQSYFSDCEGFFEQRGRGMTRISGSVRERHEAERVHRFVKELRRRLWDIAREERPDAIILFTPKVHEVEMLLQDRLRNKVVLEVKGEYLHRKPFDLLVRIKREQEAIDVARRSTTASSRKMLRRTAVVSQKHVTWAGKKRKVSHA